jgi:hypothetical protein
MSGKVAVAVLLGPLLTVSSMSVNVTLTRIGTISSGQLREVVICWVSTVKVPLPDLVLNVSLPVVLVVVLFSPFGCCPCDPLLMQPVVTWAVAERVAVAVLPAPATSPVAVKNAAWFVFVAVTCGVPTKCRPPVELVDVAPTARAGTAATAAIMNETQREISAIG